MLTRLLIAMVFLIAPATANPLGELGRPAAGMQTLSPCWQSASLQTLIMQDGFALTSQGILTASIDPSRPAFVMYEHLDGRFIAIVRQHKQGISCVIAAGNDYGSL